MATVMRTGVDRLEQLFQAYSKLPIEAIVKEDVLTHGVHPSPGLTLPEVAVLRGGPFDLRPTVIRLRTRGGSPYEVRPAVDGFEVIHSATGHQVAIVRAYPERPTYESKRFLDGTRFSSVMDARGMVLLPLQAPKDPNQVAEAAVETFLWERWESGQSPLNIHLAPDPAMFDLDEDAQEHFVMPYVEALHEALGNRRAILLDLPPKTPALEKRLLDAGVTGRISALEVWDAAVFARIGPKCPPGDRDVWIERIIAQAHIYLENLAQPLLLVGKELSQPGGFKDVSAALASTRQGIQFFLQHRVDVRLAHWNPPAAAEQQEPAPPVEYFLDVVQFWYESWVNNYRAEPGGELLGPGWSRDPDSAFLDVGRGAQLAPLR